MGSGKGIWIDLKNAYIIDSEKGIEKVIASDIEDFHLHGGYGDSTPYSPQDATSETKLLARKKDAIRRFCSEIIDNVQATNELLIFGPAQMKIELAKEIREHKDIKWKVEVQTADNMTDNQLVEWVRNYYSAN